MYRSSRGRVLARDLVREAAKRMGCYMTDAKRLLDIYCCLIRETLAEGREVHLHGLGVFKPLPHRRRQTVRFAAAKVLRDAAARAPRLPGRVAVPEGWDGRVVAVAADWQAAREAYAAGKAVVVAFEDGTVPPEAAELLRAAQAVEAAGEGPARERLEWLLALLRVEPEPAKPRDRWCAACQKRFELPPGAEEKCPECGGGVTELNF